MFFWQFISFALHIKHPSWLPWKVDCCIVELHNNWLWETHTHTHILLACFVADLTEYPLSKDALSRHEPKHGCLCALVCSLLTERKPFKTTQKLSHLRYHMHRYLTSFVFYFFTLILTHRGIMKQNFKNCVIRLLVYKHYSILPLFFVNNGRVGGTSIEIWFIWLDYSGRHHLFLTVLLKYKGNSMVQVLANKKTVQNYLPIYTTYCRTRKYHHLCFLSHPASSVTSSRTGKVMWGIRFSLFGPSWKSKEKIPNVFSW